MSCRRRDAECGEASCCAENDRQVEEMVSARCQAPILNPIHEMRGRTSQYPGQMGLSSCIPIIECCQDRSTSKRSRTRKATKIKSAALLALLFASLCQYTTSSSISPMLHSKFPSKTERRKISDVRCGSKPSNDWNKSCRRTKRTSWRN